MWLAKIALLTSAHEKILYIGEICNDCTVDSYTSTLAGPNLFRKKAIERDIIYSSESFVIINFCIIYYIYLSNTRPKNISVFPLIRPNLNFVPTLQFVLSSSKK